MKIKAVVVCAIVLSACGKDKDSNNDNKSNQALGLVYPSALEGSYVSIAGWTVTLPATDKEAEYRWSEDSISENAVTDLIPISVETTDGSNKAEFLVQLITNQCQNYKVEPASGEIDGKTESGVNWFLRNEGATFDSFTATAKFNTCVELTIQPADNSFNAIAENSGLLHYFQLIADDIRFDRFALVRAGYKRISPFLFTSFGKSMTLVTDADGITSGSSESPFFTKDAELNHIASEAKAGDCEKPIFEQAWEELANEALEEKDGRKGKIRLETVSSEGKFNRVATGIFATNNDSKCLLLKFSLKTPVESEEVLADDTALDLKLEYELGLTTLDSSN